MNKFRNIELIECPYYLICNKCNNIPIIELQKNNESVILKCSICNFIYNEKIKNIVNYSSKYVSNAIKYCSSKHEKKIPSNIYCKIHNLFLCNECLKFHQDKYYLYQKMNEVIDNIEEPKGDDMIKIYFLHNEGGNISFNISNKTPLNEALKLFAKKIYLPENFIDELIFLSNGDILDNKSAKSLNECDIMNNQKILVMNRIDDNHEIIKFFNLKKIFVFFIIKN